MTDEKEGPAMLELIAPGMQLLGLALIVWAARKGWKRDNR